MSGSLRRTVIDIPGLRHSQPIPVGVAMGNLVVTGSINGKNLLSGVLPDDVGAEVARAFDNLGVVLEAAGTSWAGLLKLDVLLSEESVRQHVNEQWLIRFPSADDRPVRHVTKTDLPANFRIQLLALALASSDRSGKDD